MISPLGSVSVVPGTIQSFTVTSNPGASISGYGGAGVSGSISPLRTVTVNSGTSRSYALSLEPPAGIGLY